MTTIQVGALPLPGAQVVIEAISSEKKIVNPTVLRFFPAAASANAAAHSVARLAISP